VRFFSHRLRCCILAVVPFLLSCNGRDKITIRVLGEDSSNLQAMKSLAPAFQQEMSKAGRDVTVEFEPASFEDAGLRANQDFSSGGGKYDIVLQYNFSLAEYARRNYVFKVSELLPIVPDGLPKQVEGTLFPTVWREVGFYYKDETNRGAGAEAVGYPFAANTMLLVFNKRFFDDPDRQTKYRAQYKRPLSPPTTWEEFRDVAAFMTNPSRKECGVALQGKTGGWLYYEWVNILYGLGGSVMQKEQGWEGGSDLPVQIATPVAQQAAAFYAALKPYTTCGDFFSTDAPLQREQLLAGNVAMGIVWSDYLYELVANAKAKKLDFGFAPVPGGKSLIGGGSYYINRKSRHPDVAAQFVLFLLRKENQIELAKRGLCSPVQDVYADPGVQALPYINALGQSLRRATYMLEAGPDAELISNRLTEALQRIWRGEAASRVLPEAQETLARERADLFNKRARAHK
jgi:ABC-type glycerol-3-phosphate transport system substrate-binding protein